MRKFKLIGFLMVAGMLLAACAGSTGEANQAADASAAESLPQDNAPAAHLQMIVAPERVDCGDGSGEQCLQVKFDPDGDWQVLDSSIAGFDYVPGYRYTLLVAELDTQDPPAGAENAQYVLVAVEEQTEEAAMDMDAASLESAFWVLTGMGGVADPQGVLEGIQVSMQYDPAESRISGSAGCNRYFGTIQVNADQLEFTTAPMGMGRMACSEQVMAQESQFIEMLGRVQRFAIDGGTLYLFTDSDEVLLFEVGTPSGR